MTPLVFQSAAAIARSLRAGKLTASDALEMYLARHQRLHLRLNAIVVTDIDGARKAARAVDRARLKTSSIA